LQIHQGRIEGSKSPTEYIEGRQNGISKNLRCRYNNSIRIVRDKFGERNGEEGGEKDEKKSKGKESISSKNMPRKAGGGLLGEENKG